MVKRSPRKRSGDSASEQTKPDLDESIRRRAYDIWEQSGRPDDADLEHWLHAESEHTRERADTPPKNPSGGRRKRPMR